MADTQGLRKTEVRILLVDDNPDDRALVARALRGRFSEMSVAEPIDLRSLERLLAERVFDLVVTDYQLRWTDGQAVLHMVRTAMPDCPVIMFTGTGDEETAVAAMKAGLDDYVVKKPDSYLRLAMVAETAMQHRKMHRTLWEMEQHYRTLFDNVPIGLYRTDIEGRILEANPATASILGYPDVESLLHANSTDFYIDPADREHWRRRVAQEGVVHAFEFRLRRRNGETAWLRDTGRAIRNEAGDVQFYTGSLEDITENRRMRRGLEEVAGTFLKFGPDPRDNINLLVAACAGLLGATAGLYNRLDEGMLCSWGMWHTPEGFNPHDHPQGHICYDVILGDSDLPVVIQDLDQTGYRISDPNVAAYGLKTYVGKVVRLGEVPVGSLCAVFQEDFCPTQADLRTLDLLASAVGVEERRLQAIAEREQLVDEMVQLATVIEQTNETVLIAGADFKVTYSNPSGIAMTGMDAGGLEGRDLLDVLLPEWNQANANRLRSQLGEGQAWKGAVTFPHGGNPLSVEISLLPVRAATGDVTAYAAILHDVSEQVEHARLLEATASMAYELRAVSSRTGVLQVVLQQARKLLLAGSGAVVTCDDPQTGAGKVALAVGQWSGMSGVVLSDSGLCGRIQAAGTVFSTANLAAEPDFAHAASLRGDLAAVAAPFFANDRMSGVVWVGRETPFTAAEAHLLMAIAGLVGGALQRAELFEITRQYADQMSAVTEMGRALAETLNENEIHSLLGQAVRQLLPNAARIYLATTQGGEDTRWVYGLVGDRLSAVATASRVVGNSSVVSRVMEKRQAVTLQEPLIDLESRGGAPRSAADQRATLYVPMLVKDHPRGVIVVQAAPGVQFAAFDAGLLALVGNYAAIAMENARLFHETGLRLRQVHALHAIDTAITGSLDLRVILDILLGQVIEQLGLDGADVHIYDAPTQAFKLAAQRGLRQPLRRGSSLRMGEGLGGRAALERRILSTGEEPDPLPGRELPADLPQPAYAAPLLIKGLVKGMLQVYLPAGRRLMKDELDFLEAVAAQAAIAIENTTTFNDLNRSNIELQAAYDATLDSLARAAELRDPQGIGHTQRIIELTVALARAVGVDAASLEHIERGARLHDIGSLALPERVVDRRRSLSEDEMRLLHKAPQFAYELLAPISYLSQAMNIPYYCREAWDGSGYPQRLKGEQIPLAARLFAVAEAWDELLNPGDGSPAPGRKEAAERLLRESGRRLDPALVRQFLALVVDV